MFSERHIDVRIAPAFKGAKVLLPIDMKIGEMTLREILELPMDRFVAYMDRIKEKRGGEHDTGPVE